MQHDAIVVATQVVLDHYGLAPGNVISHAEWTARKRDPFWNGDRRCIEQIRAQLEDDDDMKPSEIAANPAELKAFQALIFGTNMPNGKSFLFTADDTFKGVKALLAGDFRTISDADLARIAKASADEQARRLVE